MISVEITVLTKVNGPLTKIISLSPEGRPVSNGNQCFMSKGRADRTALTNPTTDLAHVIGGLGPSCAIALGALNAALPDRVDITTKERLSQLNGTAPSNLITRTADHITYTPGNRAFALIDIDTKGMPASVRKHIDELGGFWQALLTVVPELKSAARVTRASTSAGLGRADTGEKFPQSDGQHIYVLVQDGADIERFLRTFHDRCWLNGLGWFVIGNAGQFLDRSIVDWTVFAAERLVFEGKPLLVDPIVQDPTPRIPVAHDGTPLDTFTTCPSLTLLEQAKAKSLRAAARKPLAKAANEANARFVCEHADRLVKRTGCTLDAAQKTIKGWCGGVLTSSIELPFDREEHRGATVADVLADPDRFIGATLADPLAGAEYGIGKAKILRRADGRLFIHSFAHGRAFYGLRHSAAAIEAAIAAADDDAPASRFIDMMANADIGEDEVQRIKERIVAKTGTKLRALNAMLKGAIHEMHRAAAKQQKDARAAAPRDKRFILPAPAPDDERLPILHAIDGVLGASTENEPPMRTIDGAPVEVRERVPTGSHELTRRGANGGLDDGKTKLSPPTLALLSLHDRYSFSHLVERYIRFESSTDDDDVRPVALSPVFIDHYINYRDSVLPRVSAVLTSPLVLTDGTLLAPKGLDRARRLVFRVDTALLEKLPTETPTPEQAAGALDFLINEWLCDVAGDFTSRCVLIAMAMSIIERVMLKERPAFFVTAGKRGGGKTTALSMIILAVTGKKPPAVGWSSSEEERRKAMLAHLSEGLPALVWDNLSLGSLVSCRVLDAVLTTEEFSDRVLTVSKNLTVPAYTIMAFTGNNIAPKGDLASRSLVARLDVDRPDPENRPFRHKDPIAWTLDNRGEILRALYAVMMANPTLQEQEPDLQTRFKDWMLLVGTAIEHAAKALVEVRKIDPNEDRLAGLISFSDVFKSVEAEDEETAGIAECLALMRERWPYTFGASDVANFLVSPPMGQEETASALRSVLCSERDDINNRSIGRRLVAMCDAPVMVDGATLKLISKRVGTKPVVFSVSG